ncbi:non-SMC mitotic condensation complex subunit 1-domain-containing protein [Tribonema minus]|uniref:Non-SMC mitotic condensation complex subunit 1-domain-containing protein n=1 Tax=Tribonema minus TaxID=303371 RepID=A0A836CLB4_9STRA|nr:non-SMC mitotic condensation complex subunit 1-domain-containing protein [Tribonema minus]
MAGEQQSVEFVVPLELEDLELPRQDRYHVKPGSLFDPKDAQPAQLHAALDEVASDLADAGPEALSQCEGAFDTLYRFVRDFKELPDDAKARVIDMLRHLILDVLPSVGGAGSGAKKRGAGGNRRESDPQQAQQQQGQAPLHLRNSFKMAVFLLFSAAWRAESAYSSAKRNELLAPKQSKAAAAAAAGGAKKGARKTGKAAAAASYDWETAREAVLTTMATALSADLQRLWSLGVADQEFASLFTRLAFKALELPATLRSRAARAAVLELIAVPYASVSGLAIPVCAAALQAVTAYEHLPAPMAELCARLAAGGGSSSGGDEDSAVGGGGGGDTRLAAELLREIGRMSAVDAARNAAGLRNMVAFMTELCALLPGVAHAALPVLLPHLGSEPYALRSGVVTCVAAVAGAAMENDLRRRERALGGSAQLQGGGNEEEEEERARGRVVTMDARARDGLLDILEERAARDASGYTRAAALRAWTSLAERGALPLTRIPAAAALGADRLCDRAALVRRAAAQLLGALLERNPYGASLAPEFHRERAEVAEAALAEMAPAGPQLTPEETAALAELEERSAGNKKQQRRSRRRSSSSGSGAASNADDASEQEEEEGSDGGDGDAQDDELESSKLSADGSSGGSGDGGSNAEQPAAAGEEEEDEAAAARRRALQLELSFHASALAFGDAFASATPRLCELLSSRSAGDVTEALRLLARARRFGARGAADGARAGALALAWHAEPAVREEAARAFVEAFVECDDDALAAGGGGGTVEGGNDGEEEEESSAAAAAVRAGHNLVVLVAQSTAADLVSLEEVVGGLVRSGALPRGVFERLWAAAAARAQQGWARAAALRVLAMGVAADASLAPDAERLRELATVALGKATQDARDWVTVKAACTLLERCAPAPRGDRGAAAEACLRRITGFLQACLRRIAGFLQGAWCDDEGPNAEGDMDAWFAAAEAALGALFRHAPRPEAACAGVVRAAAAQTLCLDTGAAAASPLSLMRLCFIALCLDTGAAAVSPLSLARLCFIVGHAALRLLVYAEDLASRIKRARGDGSGGSGGGSGGGGAAKSKLKGAAAQQGDASDGDEGSGGGGEEEAEQTGGTSAEQDADDDRMFQDLVDREIVGRNLLGLFGPLLARIVANEDGAFGHPLLRESAVLALAKYMCVSAAACERYLPLLFTALAAAAPAAAARGAQLRSTIVVALGDLAFRFPNALEPWGARMYACLRDSAPRVRGDALLVLTHLILNDMVKVKGQVSEIALRLRDALPRLRDAAKLFFTELSKRGDNPIYNLLPDIVSRLSQEPDLPPGGFREIMGFLLSFIKKDRQAEGLLDKLCARVAAAADAPQQRRDLAYCLAQLQQPRDLAYCLAQLQQLRELAYCLAQLQQRRDLVYCLAQLRRRDLAYCLVQLQVTEKGVKRLAESIATYKDAFGGAEDALGDAEVYGHFQALAARAKKFAKPELRAAVEEWEAAMAQLHAGGADNEGAATRATKAAPRSRKAAAAAAARSSAAALDMEAVEAPKPKAAPGKRAPPRKAGGGGATAAAAKGKKSAAATKKKKKEWSSSSEEDGDAAALSDSDGGGAGGGGGDVANKENVMSPPRAKGKGGGRLRRGGRALAENA